MSFSPPIFIYRIGNRLHRLHLRKLSKLLSYFNRFAFGVWLPCSAQIGKNFVLGYWGIGIVIHSNAIIGNNCQVNQNVTIGRNLGDVKVPVLGNNVYVGAGTVIFGEITIGNNVTIGSNSVVNKSIPDNSIVAGNPAKILRDSAGLNFRDLDLIKSNK